MADEMEQGQLIPQSFSVVNKVFAAHYGVTLLNSREMPLTCGELISLNLWLRRKRDSRVDEAERSERSGRVQAT